MAAALSAPHGTQPFEDLAGWEEPLSSGEKGRAELTRAEEVSQLLDMALYVVLHFPYWIQKAMCGSLVQ